MPKPSVSICGAIILSALAIHGRADVYWALPPGQTGDWSVPSNWGGKVPSSSDRAYIANGGTANITTSGDACGTLLLGGIAASGTVIMSDGSLSTSAQYLGNSGTGSFTQMGGLNLAGSLSLAVNSGSIGSYNLSGGTLVVASIGSGTGTAVFNFNGGTLRTSGPLSTTLPMFLGNSGSAPTFDTAGSAVTLSGALFGFGDLTKVGSGTLKLAAVNTYYGKTLVNGGTLLLGNAMALAQSTLDTSGSGTLSFGSLTVATLGQLSGSGLLGLSNSASAAVALSVGNNNTSTTYSGGLQGAGSLAKFGTGTLTLTGSNSYRNGTTINAGALSVPADYCLGAGSGGITLGGSSKLIAGANGLVLNSARPIIVSSGGTSTIDTQAYSMIIAGSITGGGGLTKIGAGTLTLSGSNSYSGTTMASAGTLLLNNTAALSASTFDASGAGTLSFGTLGAAGFGGLQGTASSTLTLSNTILGGVALVVGENNVTTTYNGILAGNGSLTKAGTGALLLAGSSAFVGGTNINAGVLQFANAGACPALGVVSIGPHGALVASSGPHSTINGWLASGTIASSSSGAVALTSSSADSDIDFTLGGGYDSLSLGAVGSVTYTGTITPGTQGYFLGGGGGTLTLGTSLSDNSSLTPATVMGPGVVLLTASNSYSGPTTVSGGTLTLGNASALPLGTNLSLDGGTIDLRGFNTTVGVMASSPSGGALTSTSGTAALSVTTGGSFKGVISGPIAVTLTGGSLALSGSKSSSISQPLSIGGGGAIRITAGSLSTPKIVVGSGGGGSIQVAGGSISSANQYIGYSSNGDFTQLAGANSGVTNLYMGYNAGVLGTYTLSGTGALFVPGDGTPSSNGEYIGYSGSGSFTQLDASTNNLQYQSVYLGYNAGSNGDYTLNSSESLRAAQMYIGYSGTGSLTQLRGNVGNSLTNGKFIVGYNAGSSGTYSLSGTGQIYLGDVAESIGYSGTGMFLQSGGNNTTNTNLFLGAQAGGHGTYCLSGSGQLSVKREYVGYSSQSTALFQQTGGSNSAYYVSVSSGGKYVLSGGTLSLRYGGLSNQGVFDGGNGGGLLRGDDYSIVDLSRGQCVNVGSLSVSMGTSSLLVVPNGFDPYINFGSYVSLGVTHTAGTTLAVPANQGFGGEGTIQDPVICQGTIAGSLGNYAINLNKGLIISGTGNVNLGGGNLVVNDATSGMTGGTLNCVQNHYVGYGGNGLFTQYNGNYLAYTVNPPCRVFVGYNAGDSGTYVLSGTGQMASQTFVGYFGNGTFQQTGGTNSGGPIIGYGSGSFGTYVLTGSESVCGVLTVGNSGSGVMAQSGGTNSNTGSDLTIGYALGASGTYSLSGIGVAKFWDDVVGAWGAGVFLQSGGTNSIGSQLILAQYPSSRGTYDLRGGVLILSGLSRGSGDAAFTLSGGTLRAGNSFSTSVPLMLGNDGGGATFDTGGYSLTLAGSLSGPGGLLKAGSGMLNLATANRFIGNTLIMNGMLALSSSLSLQNSTLDTSGTGTLNFGSLTKATLGGLLGSGMLSLTNSSSVPVALSVGNNDSSTSFAGTLRGPGSLIKIGSGSLALSGSNSYGGATIVTAGVLGVTNVTALPDGGSLTIGANAGSMFGGAVATGTTASTPAAVPEPSSVALLVTGVVGLAAYARLRRRGSLPAQG
jgi:fibronectin-binding autotransporter adhesin